jgi:YidC/Oxa1 family membrane protein insertase
LGWPPVNWINRYLIIPVFHFLERFIGNYGIIILLLTVFIRLLIIPLTYKSYLSMAKTKLLKPELDAIKEKYKDDMQKAQSEQMSLYSKAGVNPLSGCIPMLLQMPILFAMFYFFPNSIELRHEPFLWAQDLSTYDSIISWTGWAIPLYGSHVSLFTILMTLSTILYTWSNSQMTSMQGPMKTMAYVMPLVFMFVLNNFSSALTYYYFLSNIISFVLQVVIKRFVNEEKIKAIMDENKLKYKVGKKSKFQLKLEEAMKAKTEVAAAKSNGKGAKRK